MKWFKFYGQDYLSDPKMLSLNSCERSCWITLLAYSSVNDNGMITYLEEEQLIVQAGVSPMHEQWEQTKGILKKLEKLGMITIDNGMITVINWKKRQETNLTSYERVKRHRKKKHNDNTMITLEENRIEENRKEKEVSDETSPSLKEGLTEHKTTDDGEEIGVVSSRKTTDPVHTRINQKFRYMSENNIGAISPLQIGKQGAIIKSALKVLNEKEIYDLFEWWFEEPQQGKEDHDLIQITQALSGYNISRYKSLVGK